MSKIFISHCSADNAAALALAAWLEQQGWGEYFLDISMTRGIASGERWQEALKAAADRCEAVIIALSPAWLRSTWCLAEYLLAKQLGKRIFGVLIEPTPLGAVPVDMTSEWQLCDLVAGATRERIRVSHDPLLAETEVCFAASGLQKLRLGLLKAGVGASTFPWPPASDPTRSPYRGLRALEEADAAVFFGRDADVVRGLDALRSMADRGVEKLMVLLGASGSGKSSFLRAGLLPRLRRDDLRFLPLPVIRPERAVLSGSTGLVASLATAFGNFGRQCSHADVRQLLEASDGFSAILAELQQLAGARIGHEAQPVIVIPVDQGEELYAAERGEEAAVFLALLAKVLAEPRAQLAHARAIAIVAIRSESYPLLQTEPRLSHVKPHIYALNSISRGEFKAVIEWPAARSAEGGLRLTVEPALTEKLLLDAVGQDALPLLAFTLERLFLDYGGDGDLRLEEYEMLGGVQGSLQAAISSAFAGPGRVPAVPAHEADRERLLRRAFIPWLALVDPDTGERMRRVASWEDIPEAGRPLLARLVEARLLVRYRRVVEGERERREEIAVEIAHDALLRQWAYLDTWLTEDTTALRRLEAVKRAASAWSIGDKSSVWLVHAGSRLAEAQELMRRQEFKQLLGDEGVSYIRACEEREARSISARRQAIGALSALVVVLCGLALYALRQAQHAADAALRESDAARLAIAQSLRDDPTTQALVLREIVASTTRGFATAAVSILHMPIALSIFDGHENFVTSAVFNHDGSRVLTSSDDKTARVWNADGSGECITLRGHEDLLRSAVFSPDGRKVVTSSEDKTARVWNADGTGQPVVLRGHEGPVTSAVFSPDGRRILTSSFDKTARVWSTDGSRAPIVLRGHEDAVTSAIFSPDGRKVLTGSDDKTARVWNADGSGVPISLRGHEDAVTSAIFSPDGRKVLTGSSDKTARVWNADGSGVPVTLRGHTASVNEVAFSPDGRKVLTGSDDKTARVWNTDGSGDPIVLRGHEDAVERAAFSPDGGKVLTGSVDRTARVWNADDAAEPVVLRGHEGWVLSAVFSPDGHKVLTGSSDRSARVWYADGPNEPIGLRGHQGPVTSAVFSPDGRQALTNSTDKTARVWNADGSGKPIVLRGHEDAVTSAVFSPDGRRVLTGSTDKTARVWNADGSGEPVILRGHADAITSAVFSPDGRNVLTCSSDNTARVWNSDGSGEPVILRGHADWVNSAVFSADGCKILTGSSDKTARVWNSDGSGEPVILRGHTESVNEAAFSPDGYKVLTGSLDKTARVWNTDGSGEPIVLRGHENSVDRAAFSPDGRKVLTGSADRTARVWNADGIGEPIVLRGHEGWVLSAVFSPDGCKVLTGSADRTARVWNADGNAEPTILREDAGAMLSAVFSPDGRKVLTGLDDHTARVWRLAEPDALRDALWTATRSCLSAARRQLLLGETPSAAAEGLLHCRAKVASRIGGP